MERSPLKRNTPLRAKKKPKRKKKSALQKRKDKMDSAYWNRKCHEAVTEWAHKSACLICGQRECDGVAVSGHHLIRKSKSRLYRWHPNNIIPLCAEHHLHSVTCAAHSENVLAVARFVECLKTLRRDCYDWLQEHQHAIRQTDMRVGQIERPDWRYQLTIWEQRIRDIDALKGKDNE